MITIGQANLLRFNKKINELVKKGQGSVNKEELKKIDNEVSIASSIPEGAAIYYYRIITEHPFTGGNRRTAFLAADVFLQINGYKFIVDQDKFLKLGKDVRERRIEFKELVELFKNTTKKENMKGIKLTS